MLTDSVNMEHMKNAIIGQLQGFFVSFDGKLSAFLKKLLSQFFASIRTNSH